MPKTKRHFAVSADVRPTEQENTNPQPTNHVISTIVICLVLAAVTTLVFLPVRGFEFVNYDDTDYVSENPHVKNGFSVQSVVWAFTSGHAANWHPLTWISHMIDCELFGLHAGKHHLVNLLFHLTNTLLLFALLLKMTGARWRSALVAALFALHPLHVESVAWISERKDVLSTFFWLSATWAYAAYAKCSAGRESPNNNMAKRTWYLVSLLCFAAGLLSKAMLVTLPFTLLLLDFWPLRRFSIPRLQLAGGPAHNNGKKSFAKLTIEKIPFLVLAVFSCGITFFVQKQWGAVYGVSHLSLQSRVENALVSYSRYLGKTYWPRDMAIPYPMPDSWPGWMVAFAVILLSAVSWAALRQARRHPYFVVGWLWFLGTLVPVIGLVQVGMQSMADRYTYVPLIGIFIAFTWGTAVALQTWRVQRAAVAAGIIGVLAALVLVTSRQVQHWRDTETLFKHAIAVTKENFFAHYNLGNKLFKMGRIEEAISHYEAALSIRPGHAKAHNNLGLALEKVGRNEEAARHYAEAMRLDQSGASEVNVANSLLKLGKIDEAIAKYRQILQTNRNSPEANHNLGVALMQQKKFEEAVVYFQKALLARAGYVDAHFGLATAFAQQDKLAEAAENYRAVVRIAPAHFEAHKKLAELLADMGQTSEAIEHYSRARELKPSDANVHNGLGIAFAMQGNMDAAIASFEQAVRLKPDFAGSLANLGYALASKGKLDEAVEYYEKALKVAPNDEQTLSNMAMTLAQQGKLHEAITHFETALRIDGNNFQTRFNFGVVLANADKLEDAVEQLNHALRLRPGSPEVHARLALLKNSAP